jgi:cytochrome c oxidase assembly protein subunit 15
VKPAHRLAVLTAAATGVLIVFGGLVTNTGAALAVPDWPTTFGHNMFLYPPSGWVGGVFYEHSHRLLGALVGLLTIALAVTLWRGGGRLRALGIAAVVAVVAQGVIGGLRVVLTADGLAMIHGPFAQAFFAFVVALALLTSPRMAAPAPALDGATRGLTAAAAALVYLQIVFGALLTHAGYLALHLLGALAVFVVAPMATARLRRSGDAVAAPAARLTLVLLGVQLLLGAGSYLARFSAIWIPGGQATMLVVPVAHRLVGGLLLAATVVMAVRVLATVRPSAALGVPGVPRAIGVAR